MGRLLAVENCTDCRVLPVTDLTDSFFSLQPPILNPKNSKALIGPDEADAGNRYVTLSVRPHFTGQTTITDKLIPIPLCAK